MKTVTFDFTRWSIDVTIGDDTTWRQIFDLASQLSGICVGNLEISYLDDCISTEMLDKKASGDHLDVSWNDSVVPLVEAAQNGNLEAIQRWVKSGADINEMDYRGATPLMLASELIHTECVKKLLQLGADSRALDSDGCTALHWAAIGANHSRDAGELVRLLIIAGCHESVRNDNGRTAIEVARRASIDWGTKFEYWVTEATALAV